MELYSKQGAEGRTAHSENGISRTYEASDVSPSLLSKNYTGSKNPIFYRKDSGYMRTLNKK